MIKLLLLCIFISFNCSAVEESAWIKFSHIVGEDGVGGKIEVLNRGKDDLEIYDLVDVVVFVGDSLGNSVVPPENPAAIDWQSPVPKKITVPPGGIIKIGIKGYWYNSNVMLFSKLKEAVKADGLIIIGYQIKEDEKDKSDLHDKFMLENSVHK